MTTQDQLITTLRRVRDHDMSALDDLVDLAASALLPHLDRYRVTSHGRNPWTLAGVLNAVALAPHVERAAAAVDARITSVYRSPSINTKVQGDPRSFHLRAAAADLQPGDGWSVDSAAEKLKAEADAGRLGPVHKVVREYQRGIVHVQWFTDGRSSSIAQLVTDSRY